MSGNAGAQEQIGPGLADRAEAECHPRRGLTDLELDVGEGGLVAARKGKAQLLAGADQNLATALAEEAAARIVVDGADRTDHCCIQAGDSSRPIRTEESIGGINAIEQQGDLAVGQSLGVKGGEIDQHGCRYWTT